MPYQSKAQQGYMHAAMERGEMPQEMMEEFNRESKGKKNLPEHAGKNRRKKKKKEDGGGGLGNMINPAAYLGS